MSPSSSVTTTSVPSTSCSASSERAKVSPPRCSLGLGADLPRVRQHVIQLLSGYGSVDGTRVPEASSPRSFRRRARSVEPPHPSAERCSSARRVRSSASAASKLRADRRSRPKIRRLRAEERRRRRRRSRHSRASEQTRPDCHPTGEARRSAVVPRDCPPARTTRVSCEPEVSAPMDRVFTNELTRHVGERVRLAGWLHHQRALAHLTFVLAARRQGRGAGRRRRRRTRASGSRRCRPRPCSWWRARS